MKVVVVGKCDDGAALPRAAAGDDRVLRVQQVGHVGDCHRLLRGARGRRLRSLLLQHDGVAAERADAARLVHLAAGCAARAAAAAAVRVRALERRRTRAVAQQHHRPRRGGDAAAVAAAVGHDALLEHRLHRRRARHGRLVVEDVLVRPMQVVRLGIGRAQRNQRDVILV